jgi:hypothetical protein
MINVHLVSLTGKHHFVSVESTLSLKKLAFEISDLVKIPSQNIRFKFCSMFVDQNSTLQDLGYDETMTLFVHKRPSNNSKSSCFISNSISSDPENFYLLLDFLHSLGFSKSLCIEALRKSNYNIDRAADFLLENQIKQNSTFSLPVHFSTHFFLELSRLPYPRALILQIYAACDYQRESTLKSLKGLNF